FCRTDESFANRLPGLQLPTVTFEKTGVFVYGIGEESGLRSIEAFKPTLRDLFTSSKLFIEG
ncbi:hypothetical protein AVEN_259076-1, partial [Araneus ventricosus]